MKSILNKVIVVIILTVFVQACTKESTSGSEAMAANSTGKAGSLSKFTIVGNYLYAVDLYNLYTYDITDPANPIQTNSTGINFNVETIYPFKDNLFIGTTDGLYIFSVSDPANPVQVGEARHARSCDPVVANDSFAFVTLKGSTRCGPAQSGLYVHDISNLFNPTLVKTVALPDPEGLGLEGSTLYVCCGDAGLKVFNVSNSSNPVEIRTVTGAYFKDVIPYGNLLICYVSTGIMLYDIADPTNPVEVKLIGNS